MSIDWTADVIDWHRKFCPERIGATPRLDRERVPLLFALIEEEFRELATALEAGHLPAIADGGGDLIYVVLGAMTTMGIDMRPVWDAIQTANMAKEGGSRRADGKVLKPPGWQPPDVAAVLARQEPIGLPE